MIDDILNIKFYYAILLKLEEYGNCLTLEMEEDDENPSKCLHNITTVVAEMGLTSEDIGLDDMVLKMWPQELTASDPSPLTVPPSKASSKAFPDMLQILPFLLFFARPL